MTCDFWSHCIEFFIGFATAALLERMASYASRSTSSIFQEVIQTYWDDYMVPNVVMPQYCADAFRHAGEYVRSEEEVLV